MPKLKYQDITFSESNLKLIATANTIIAEYQSKGFNLTLRQLYYQFVARALVANTDKSYKHIGGVISDARLAGLIDWESIVDRTRGVRQLQHWGDPSQIVGACAEQFHLDRWSDQRFRPEVWIEKDALAGIFSRICTKLDVPLLSCRGYTSQSEMWASAQRLVHHKDRHQVPVIFHFGDHDPSGRDMSRDIKERLQMFTGGGFYFRRVALNMDQIKLYGPPPNPAKVTDSRAKDYIAEFGDESWELDALEPSVLEDLAREAINSVMNQTRMSDMIDRQQGHRDTLSVVASKYHEIITQLGGE